MTRRGTVVLVLTRFENDQRAGNGVMRSADHGATWTDYAPLDGDFVGYPCSVAVAGDTNYLLVDSNSSKGAPGSHVLYASTDDEVTWKSEHVVIDAEAWYGALCTGGRRLVAAPS